MTQPSSRAKRRKARAQQAEPSAGQRIIPAIAPAVRRLRPWHWAAFSILGAAAVIRLIYPDMKPLHHDEGVNGLFLTTLFRNGYYHYDPSNYHGPTLYYFAWITTTINSFFYGKEGLSTSAIRLVTALFGVGIVWLMLCLRRQLGDFGSLSAAALAAVSPGLVFFSRYFIHEILFVFFSLGVVVAVLRFPETQRPRYLMLASLSAALLCATKETWVITVAVWLIAIPCTRIYLRLRRIPEESAALRVRREYASSTQGAASGKRDWSTLQLYATAALLFVAVWVLFYSSFFTNFPQGVYDSVRTFGYWFKTSSSAHTYGPDQYLTWLRKAETSVLILGALGVITALVQATNRFAVFAAFWSLGILSAYSLVHYKTPWLALNIVLPFILAAGYGLEQLYRWRRPLGVMVATIAVGVCLYQAIYVSFFHYDDDTQAYVYAHTRREFLSLVNEIDSIAAGNPAGKDIGITVMSPEHWPLPWYLRDYKNAGYWGQVTDSSEPILVVREDQVAEVDRRLGNRYRQIGSYDLRPGVRLYLYLRKDVQR
ncbi:MAG TPA: flippase activity-associated protein Agl23 [Candidatus Angelobacter sp.]